MSKDCTIQDVFHRFYPVETMAAVTVLDLLLQNMGSRLDSVKNFYENEKK